MTISSAVVCSQETFVYAHSLTILYGYLFYAFSHTYPHLLGSLASKSIASFNLNLLTSQVDELILGSLASKSLLFCDCCSIVQKGGSSDRKGKSYQTADRSDVVST